MSELLRVLGLVGEPSDLKVNVCLVLDHHAVGVAGHSLVGVFHFFRYLTGLDLILVVEAEPVQPTHTVAEQLR